MEVYYTSYADFTINDPAHFSSEIKKLGRYEQLQVLKIILESGNSSYTENSNGSYVSLHTIKDKRVLYDIHQYMFSSKMNKKRLEEEESKREEEIKQFLSTISDKSKEIHEEKSKNEEDFDDEIMGEKVILKKNKVKFSGNKGKLLKSFRNVSKINKSNIKTNVSTKQQQQKKTLFITEATIDEEDDIDEDDISNQGYDDDEEEEEDVKDVDICEEEAEIEHEEISDNNEEVKEGKEGKEDDDEEDDEEDDDEDEDEVVEIIYEETDDEEEEVNEI